MTDAGKKSFWSFVVLAILAETMAIVGWCFLAVFFAAYAGFYLNRVVEGR